MDKSENQMFKYKNHEISCIFFNEQKLSRNLFFETCRQNEILTEIKKFKFLLTFSNMHLGWTKMN